MKVAILLILAFFVAGSLAASGLDENHSEETAQIRKYLNKMLAKHEAMLKDVQKSVTKVEKNTVQLRAKYESAKKALAQGEKYEEEMDSVEAKEEASVKRERELIAKILAMLSHHAGESKGHPAKSCGEIMRHGGYKSGMYWVLDGTQAKRVFCQAKGKGVVNGYGQLVFSGGCAQASKGSGWSYMCLSDEEKEFRTQDEKSYAKLSGDQVIVQKKGLYRINVVNMMYASGTHSTNMIVYINGQNRHYSWDQSESWHSQKADFIQVLKPGDKIRVRSYTNTGGGYRWHAKDGLYGYNRIQVSFIGAPEENPMFSGSCNGHSRGNGWATFCTDRTEFDTSAGKKFLKGDYLTTQGTGSQAQWKVQKAGYYRFNVHWESHSNGWTSHHGKIHVNGRWNYRGHYHHHYARQWSSHKMDSLIKLNEGDKVEVQIHSHNGNPYRWHAAGSRFENNRIQIQYFGSADAHVPRLRAGPASHDRHTGWRRFRLEKDIDPFTAQKWFDRSGNGQITIKRDAMYRIQAVTLAHSNSNSDRQMRLVVNGKDWARSRFNGRSWEVNGFDVEVPLKKGDKLWVEVYLSGGGNHYNYHHYGHSFFEMSPVGNRQ